MGELNVKLVSPSIPDQINWYPYPVVRYCCAYFLVIHSCVILINIFLKLNEMLKASMLATGYSKNFIRNSSS